MNYLILKKLLLLFMANENIKFTINNFQFCWKLFFYTLLINNSDEK
jgi:hypothetical protein